MARVRPVSPETITVTQRLRNHGRGKDQCFLGLEQVRAYTMVDLARVACGDQNARVDDENRESVELE